jgi:hypothetical protein
MFAAASSAWPQAVAVAEVSGTITDPSGGALPTAQVIMTETDKRQVRTTLTDNSGHYVLTALPVGPYQLEVKANGFKDYIQSGIVLQVNNNIQVNVTMQVGSVSERVGSDRDREHGRDQGELDFGRHRPAAHQRAPSERSSGHAVDHEPGRGRLRRLGRYREQDLLQLDQDFCRRWPE